jgi:hypothetical protein
MSTFDNYIETILLAHDKSDLKPIAKEFGLEIDDVVTAATVIHTIAQLTEDLSESSSESEDDVSPLKKILSKSKASSSKKSKTCKHIFVRNGSLHSKGDRCEKDAAPGSDFCKPHSKSTSTGASSSKGKSNKCQYKYTKDGTLHSKGEQCDKEATVGQCCKPHSKTAQAEERGLV